MVDGLAPHIAYYPVAALAALTAALVTLLVAVGVWKRSASPEAEENAEDEQSDLKPTEQDQGRTEESFCSTDKEIHRMSVSGTSKELTNENSQQGDIEEESFAWEPVEERRYSGEFGKSEDSRTCLIDNGDHDVRVKDEVLYSVPSSEASSTVDSCLDVPQSKQEQCAKQYLNFLKLPSNVAVCPSDSSLLEQKDSSLKASSDAVSSNFMSSGMSGNCNVLNVNEELLVSSITQVSLEPSIENESDVTKFCTYSSIDDSKGNELPQSNSEMILVQPGANEASEGCFNVKPDFRRSPSEIESNISDQEPSHLQSDENFNFRYCDLEELDETAWSTQEADTNTESEMRCEDTISHSCETDLERLAVFTEPHHDPNTCGKKKQKHELTDIVQRSSLRKVQLENSECSTKEKNLDASVLDTRPGVTVDDEVLVSHPSDFTRSTDMAINTFHKVETSLCSADAVENLLSEMSDVLSQITIQMPYRSQTEIVLAAEKNQDMPEFELGNNCRPPTNAIQDSERKPPDSENDARVSNNFVNVVCGQDDKILLLGENIINVGGTEMTSSALICSIPESKEGSNFNNVNARELGPQESKSKSAIREDIEYLSESSVFSTKTVSGRRRSVDSIHSFGHKSYRVPSTSYVTRSDFSRSLESVFFRYDVTQDEILRAKLSIHDPNLVTKVIFPPDKKSTLNGESTSMLQKDGVDLIVCSDEETKSKKVNSDSEQNSSHQRSKNETYATTAEENTTEKETFPSADENVKLKTTTIGKVASCELQRVFSEKPVDLDEKNRDDDIFLSNETGKSIAKDLNAVSLEVVRGNEIESVSKTISEESNSSDCSEAEEETRPAANSSNEESQEFGNSLFSAKVGKRKEFSEQKKEKTHAEKITWSVSGEEDNSARECYSCLPSAHVTSVGFTAVHRGIVRAVQGSGREELIEKACSEFYIDTETRRSGTTELPAYNDSKMQMADGKRSSCESHDVVEQHTSDRIGRLDELVDHLRELAGGGGESSHSAGDWDLSKVIVTPKDCFYQRGTCESNTKSDYGWLPSEKNASSYTDSVTYSDSSGIAESVVEEWDDCVHKFGKATVGLLADYYKDNSSSLASGYRTRRYEECLFGSQQSFSDCSNYTSDSSESLRLSSFNGDTGSSFSSGPDSPAPGRKSLRIATGPEADYKHYAASADEASAAEQAERFSYSSTTRNDVNLAEQEKGNEYISNVIPYEKRSNDSNNDKLKYNSSAETSVRSPGNVVHNTVSTKLSLDSLPVLETVIQKSSENIDALLEDSAAATVMDDSPRKLRLQKLFERDRERRERLRKLSERNSPSADSETQSCSEAEDPRRTLEAIETAIGHMKQIIHKEKEQSQCQKDRPKLHADEYQSHATDDKNTIDTEVRRFDLISFDSVPRQCYANLSGDETSDTPFSSDEHKFPTPSLVKHKATEQYNRNESDEWEMRILNALDDLSEYENSQKSNEKGNIFDDQFINVDSADRWRHYNRQKPNSAELTDDRRSDLDVADDLSIKTTTSSSGKIKREGTSLAEAIELFSSIDQRTVLSLDPSYRSHKKSSEKSKSEGESAACRWRRSAACDVYVCSDQSLASRVGKERALGAAAASRTPFSDELRKEQVSEMESGGCEMEKTTSPPPAPTANAATNTTPTPTKIKNLRFKLDPDIYDLPSENGFYAEEDGNQRPGWRKQPKYHTFSSLELGRSREPVKVVSVKTSVVPGGTKMVVKPVCVSEGQPLVRGQESEDPRVMVKQLDIDLHIRLETNGCESAPEHDTEKIADVVRGDFRASPDRHPKRSYLSSSPSQSKRRSPIPDFGGWNQSLSPVSENCDWIAVSSTSPEENGHTTDSDTSGRNKLFSLDNPLHSPSRSVELSVTDGEAENSKISESSANNSEPQSELHEKMQSRNAETLRQSSDFSKDSAVNSPGTPYTSTPSRPSTLELNHFRKHLQIPRKKFVPDPDAVERITGFKAAEEKSVTKPPLPPAIRSSPSSHRLSSGAKSRIDQLRKKYLDSKSLMAAQKTDGSAKFEQFLNRAQEDRAKLATSTPDLAAFEAAVRRQWSKMRNNSSSDSSRKENRPPSETKSSGATARCTTPDDVWVNYVQLLRRQLNRRSQSMSYLETDIDAFFAEDKCQSLMTLERSPPSSVQSLVMPTNKANRISMSLEESGRTKSEHELRIEKSLQNLSLPDWYKHSQRPKTGFILAKKSEEKRGWAAAKSLTSSTQSLSSSGSKPRRPARSLRTSHENLIWSRGSASPASADNSYSRYARTTNAPVLSLAVAKAFREPYMGWRARTPSSCASPSPLVDNSPPSWVVMDNTDRSDTPLTSDLQAMDEEEDTGLSFDGEDVIEDAESSNRIAPVKLTNLESPPPSADDTCNDIINISMDTCDHPSGQHDDSKSVDLPGEDTCDDIKNITMDTFELFPPNINEEHKTSPIGDDTCDDVLNISTDTSSQMNPVLNGNHGTSSVIGVTEDTGLDIDDISTDTSNLLLSQPVTGGRHDENSSVSDDQDVTNSNREADSPPVLTRNLNENNRSPDNHKISDNYERITASNHLVNGNSAMNHDDHQGTNGNDNAFITSSTNYQSNGNSNQVSSFNPSSQLRGSEEKNKLDSKRKRYSYNRSIYQSEFDASKNRNLNAKRNNIDGSSQSLPGENSIRDTNKVIWIESSFVGARTTTSIVVLPTDVVKTYGCKGSTGSNSSVGRPASR